MRDAVDELNVPMKDLTFLSAQVDPFRIDTPARDRDARWLADAATHGFRDGRTIHLRGLHYLLASAETPLVKPDGTPYVNDGDNWAWLQEAAKAARWLGHIGFDQVVDNRNAPPVVRLNEETPDPWQYVHLGGVNVEIPATIDMDPVVDLLNFTGRQPYRIVLAGEKSSLAEELGPIATRYDADLYLPTGEMSDTMIHGIAKSGAEDGRPVVVLYFADCDPSGWQMPISVARKLQAMAVNLYPALEFRVQRVGLTPGQVRQYGLPTSVLKETEKRAGKWRDAMGVEQTEIDALAALRPELLRDIAMDAIAPYYDSTLQRRTFEESSMWIGEAQAVIDESTDQDQLDRLRELAEAKLADLGAEIAAINDELRIDASGFSLPPVPAVPEPIIDHGAQPLPLLDSSWAFALQSQRLIESKSYGEGVAR
ncbi:MAG: hypothetical protein ACR2JF_17300 [Iamia sp.]